MQTMKLEGGEEMQRKKWKKSKAVLPLMLSALMVVEPMAVNTVYAAELSQTSQVMEPEQEPNTSEIPI